MSHFAWKLYLEELQLEALRARKAKSLFISRNHSKVDCDCLARVIAISTF